MRIRLVCGVRTSFSSSTLAEKLQRIAQQGCTHFLDDLPELLAEPGFPAGVHSCCSIPRTPTASYTV